MALLVGNTSAVSVRLIIPWVGAWLADVDLDLASTEVLPSGRVTAMVGSDTLMGTVDPFASGRFGEKARGRIIAGGGGWDRAVAARDFQNDAGLWSSAVLAATAAEIGESVVDATPILHGSHFVRAAGAASKVFLQRDWYVDAAGITRVGARTPVAAPADLDILSWDPTTRIAELASDSVVWPGTVLTDTRFNTVTVRAVEQRFGEGRARALAWCGTAASSSLTSALGSVASHAVGATHLRLYRYRVVAQNSDERLLLQTVKPGGVVPDALPIDVWPGMAGLSAEITPGTEVLLGFIEGDPAQPVVLALQSEAPLTLTFDATSAINLGKGATSPAAKGDELARCIADLRSAISKWAPVAQDGGAALKTALTTWLSASYDFESALVRVK
jgi:hypothetical protein